MISTDSKHFFEISLGPQPDNSFAARMACLKDFLKRLLGFPFVLIGKAGKTLGKAVGVLFAAISLVATLGSSVSAREFFVDRIASFAKELADWVLLPLALGLCFVRLCLALLIHPHFYFNGS